MSRQVSLIRSGGVKGRQEQCVCNDRYVKDFAFVKVNESNIGEWPRKCGFLKESALVDGATTQAMNSELAIEIGDLVVAHRRPKYLYGGNTLMGRVRLHIANALQEKGVCTSKRDAAMFIIYSRAYCLLYRIAKDRTQCVQIPLDRVFPVIHTRRARGSHMASNPSSIHSTI